MGSPGRPALLAWKELRPTRERAGPERALVLFLRPEQKNGVHGRDAAAHGNSSETAKAGDAREVPEMGRSEHVDPRSGCGGSRRRPWRRDLATARAG